jgi:hypothetical protein
MRAPLFILVSLAICSFSARAFSAATIYITPTGSGDAPTIQAGINAADPGDTVLLSNGWFAGNNNRDLDFGGKAIVVRSESGDPNFSVIHCEGTEQQPHVGFIFDTAETADAIVEGVTIQYAWGAGVYCDPEGLTEGASPTFRNCRFTNNLGPGVECFISQPTFIGCVFGYNSGNGVTLNESEVIFEDCVFTSNASAGLDAYGVITATDCVFENNGGHGAKVLGDEAHFDNCEFSGNFAGGVFSNESELHLTGCFVYDNDVFGAKLEGSGIPADTTRAMLTKCTVWNNMGSGIVAEGGEVYPTQCTIYGNSSPQGAGIQCIDDAFAIIDRCAITFNLIGQAVYCDASSDATIQCSDVYGNDGGDWVGCIMGDATINGNFSTNPLFCDQEYGNFELGSQSDLLGFHNTCGALIGAHDLGCHEPVGVDPDGISSFEALRVDAYPNPFNPATTIEYSIEESAHVTLDIYNAAGQRVRNLVDESQTPRTGGYTEIWNGQDSRGSTVSSGIYFCQLRAGDQSVTRKLVLLK